MAPRVLIVGAGIGGLTLAHALRQRGISYDIIDRAERWEDVGAGLGLWCNALRVFERLDLLARVAAVGSPYTGGTVTDARGRPITRVDYSRPGLTTPIGIAFHRADLHAVLREGLEVRMGATAGDEDFRAYDLVVGADGVRSRVRELRWGSVPLHDAGFTSWRFVVSLDRPVDGATEMWGQGKRVGWVPIGRGRVYFFSTANVPGDWDDPPEGRLARYRERFRDFGGLFARGLAVLRDDAELIHARLEDVRLDRWTRDRVALIGDAAHAMTPNLAQGAAMAVEDAWVLAETVAAGAPLDEYERARRKRVQWVQRQSWQFGVMGQLESPLACALRDLMMRLVPASAAVRRLEPLLFGGPC